jgi:hypothetical protein
MTPERFTEIFKSIEPLISDVNRSYIQRICSHREQFLQIAIAMRIEANIVRRSQNDYIRLAKKAYDIAKEINIDLLAIARETLIKKANEYSMDGDRLWNFKHNYSFMNKDPLQNLNGYLRKHLASCMDMLDGKIEPTKDMVIEKFGDVYNYCILAVAIIEENEKFIDNMTLKDL